MFPRTLNILKLLEKKSFFFFGPRSTGKTTLIQEQIPDAMVYDLLDDEVYRRLLSRPKILEEETIDFQGIIVIDEVQKLPKILDEVHRLIQKKKKKFLLTGSSARKLRTQGVNLLAGRVWEANLFPLTTNEIPNFDLLKYLNVGGLPQVYLSEDPKEELISYVGTYLREEIKAEGLTRNIQSFSEFLDIMALANGQEINFESLASDAQVSPSTLKNYIKILEDTLIGFSLKGYTKTKQRKAIVRSKHYFFDIGVVNILAKKNDIQQKSILFGDAFEHFIILEIRAYISYARNHKELLYWRTTSQMEVDLVIPEILAIEIKATHLVADKHMKGIRALKEEKQFQRYIIVSQDLSRRKTDDEIEIFPWQIFLQALWNKELF